MRPRLFNRFSVDVPGGRRRPAQAGEQAVGFIVRVSDFFTISGCLFFQRGRLGRPVAARMMPVWNSAWGGRNGTAMQQPSAPPKITARGN